MMIVQMFKRVSGDCSVVMSRGRTALRVGVLCGLASVLTACAVGERATAPKQLDLGAGAFSQASGAAAASGGSSAASAMTSLPPMPPIAVPPANSAALLTETMVVWRVGDQGQPQAYTTYQWVAPPARLVTQRIVDRLSLQGAVLQQTMGGDVPQLRLNLQRFEQTFSPDGASSQAQLTLQAVLMRGSEVLGQRLINIRVPAATQDAPGGALALRTATDQAAEQVAQWLTSVRTTAKR
ncbi:ABC-type transport auxiliary lipoprotein family protein [Zwartia vadi]|uniref:ABC-type transport auxiliary lipoprotein family protein n=1 Tax=Zwartia vadi TaxID=3058168 RepID=UPI0025B53C36|nr:ABC-type transport auxiliary lipoprotein family protein [Zwartia vadi]MDN3987432.1 ABC-type transport auxiliary lipoprotein family protein [Zwartia vadi]